MDTLEPSKSRFASWICTLLVAVAVGGCALTGAQKAAIGQFGSAASSLGTTTSTQLLAMREDTIKMNVERLVIGGASREENLANERTLDRGFEVKIVQTVIGATNALSAYGQSLTALATNTQAAALKTAGDNLVTSLGSLPGIADAVSTKQLSAIATAVQEVGGIWIEYKRKEAVRTIVLNARPAVDRLCDLLVRDFSAGGWVETQLLIVQAPLLGEASNAFQSRQSFADRRVALDAFRLAFNGNVRREQVVTQVAEAAQAMKIANANLAEVVERDEITVADIQDFASRAARLKATVEVLAGS